MKTKISVTTQSGETVNIIVEAYRGFIWIKTPATEPEYIPGTQHQSCWLPQEADRIIEHKKDNRLLIGCAKQIQLHLDDDSAQSLQPVIAEAAARVWDHQEDEAPETSTEGGTGWDEWEPADGPDDDFEFWDD